MEENHKFGARLRELRTKAGMSLRELADKVNVDFTYLSKIENGVLPPPSEKVIKQLAESLNTDKDELLTLAGKIPADIAEILKNGDTLRKLRAERAKREEKAAASSQKVLSLPHVSIPFKSLYRLAIPIFLVIAVAVSLWYASPTKALEITYPSLPSTGTLGSPYTFTVKISIADNELLPLQQVDVTIFKSGNRANYKATLQNLPKEDSSSRAHTIAEGSASGTATVAADAAPTWGYFYGTGYAVWKGVGYSFSPATGYGYGYQSGATSITYTISWTPPTNWPAGSYKIETKLTTSAQSPGGGTTFTETSSAFTLSAAAPTTVFGPGAGGAPTVEVTVEELEGMTTEEAAETVEELTGEEAAELIEEVTTEKAADIIEEATTEKAADIIEEVTTDKAADIIEEVTTEKAADIIEEVTTDKAADIIEEVATDKAADIIEEVTIEKATEIIEEVTTQKATDIIEEVTTQKAGDILAKVSTVKAVTIMEQLSTDKLTNTIPAMSETSLTERLPGLSPAKLYSVKPSVLFESLPNAPTEQLISETPPQPPAELQAPVVVYATLTGAKYLAPQTMAGEWVKVVGTPEPIDQLLIKTNKALKDVGTTIEVSEQQPPEALIILPDGQTSRAYITTSFENAAPEDIELGHLTFKIEKEWLEQNSIHKWSVALYRYDPELNKWTALSTKRVKEDDTYVYYTVTITRFSTFAISGSETLPPLTFQVTNLEVSPADAKSGADITISADVTNTSDSAGTYVATLWINGTVEAGKDVYLEAGKAASVSFTATRAAEGSYEVRVERLFGEFSVTKPIPPSPPALAPAPPTPPAPAPTPAPPAQPAPAPAPTVTPVTPVTPVNWWLIIGIIVAVIIIGVGVWQLVARRRAE